MTAGPSWDLGLVTFADTVSHAAAGDFEVVPGDPDSVLVGRDGSGLALYRDGVLKPRVGSEFYDRGQLVLAEGGTRAYADTSQSPSTLVRYDVDGEGVTFIDATWDLGGDGARIAFGGGRLYLGLKVIDPERLQVVGRLPTPVAPPAFLWSFPVVVPDVPRAMVHAVFSWDGGDWPGSLRPFDARPPGHDAARAEQRRPSSETDCCGPGGRGAAGVPDGRGPAGALSLRRPGVSPGERRHEGRQPGGGRRRPAGPGGPRVRRDALRAAVLARHHRHPGGPRHAEREAVHRVGADGHRVARDGVHEPDPDAPHRRVGRPRGALPVSEARRGFGSARGGPDSVAPAGARSR